MENLPGYQQLVVSKNPKSQIRNPKYQRLSWLSGCHGCRVVGLNPKSEIRNSKVSFASPSFNGHWASPSFNGHW
jgi:hypothetical protein